MSNQLFLDESNGNGVYASKSATAIFSTTATTTTMADDLTNNINNLMTAASTAAAAAVAASTGSASTLPTSLSSEDLSQSLSEYTDADESISAPTEFLAEFLSAVMLKDYKKALKYCKLILQYEPNNLTAKEFYPLILDKLRGANSTATTNVTASDSDENCKKSSSSELVLELQSSDPSAGESDEAASDDQRGIDDEFGGPEDNSSRESNSRSSSCGQSLSESMDDEEDDVDIDVDDDVDDNDDDGDEDDDDDVDVDEEEEDDDEEDMDAGDDVGVDDDDDDNDGNDNDDDDEEEEEEEEDINSSSGDELPLDEHHLLAEGIVLAIHGGIRNMDQGSRNSSSGGEGRSRSDNTTHSYSSLLLEEEDDIVPVNLQLPKDLSAHDLDVSNGNKLPSTSCSDSESPTEPLTQRLANILRYKCGISTNGETN